MNALCQSSLDPPGHVTTVLRPKMGKKLKRLNRYISVITDIEEKWFVIFEHTVNHLSLGNVRLLQLENNFFLFWNFFLTPFFFFFPCYLLLNR